MKKYLGFLPNTITILRVILTVLFLGILVDRLIQGLRIPAGIYVIYAFICLSDVLDGAAARGLKAESAIGGVLDVAADCLFIFSSLFIFNLFKILPVWFTAVAAANFLVFLVTSRFLIRMKPEIIRRPFVFDIAGRIAAVIFYIVPFAACVIYNHPGGESLLALSILLYVSAFLAVVSMAGRCISCFAALRYARENNNSM